jgi:hypothetical protein
MGWFVTINHHENVHVARRLPAAFPLSDHPDPVATSLAFSTRTPRAYGSALPECRKGEATRAAMACELTNDNQSD